MAPNWDNLGKFLRKRRREIERELRVPLPTPEALRRTTLKVPPDRPDRNTLINAENGEPLKMETFLYLPEIYRTSFVTLLDVLMPGYSDRRTEMLELAASNPWLAALVKGIVLAPPQVQAMLLKAFDGDEELKESRVAG